MAENSAIEWCDHTFSPWVGCTKVSPACDHCYAEGWAKRTGQSHLWADERRRTKPAYWRQPLVWNRKAAEAGVRARVFCASLADVFDNQVPPDWRADLWELIADTPSLDWLMLTKRPQNIRKMLPEPQQGYPWPWPNVWLGTTVENQEEADRRIPILMGVQAHQWFLSCEPMLSSIVLPRDFLDLGPRAWVICGGESGAGFRPFPLDPARRLRDQCAEAGVPFFMKQMGGRIKAAFARIPDDMLIREFPA